MIAKDFPSPVRGVDLGFIGRQRAKGTPEAEIARMGGWCLADVRAVPHGPPIAAIERVETPKVTERLNAFDIPEVAEILRHVAEQYDVTPADILGHSHTPECVEPRHEAMAVVFELNRYTLLELSGIFNKTGNAVLYGLRRHYQRLRDRGPGRDW